MGKLLDLEAGTSRFELDDSTFDMVDATSFRNYRCGTLTAYTYSLSMMVFLVALLGVDIYTCLNILVFKRWGTNEVTLVIPYNFDVAKWIFTGCIIFQFCPLLYHWFWAIRAIKSHKIALVYLNQYARAVYLLKLYDYFCLFHAVKYKDYFDWACFYAYEQLDNAPQLLLADAPRQVINILTLREYATKYDGNVLDNIKIIATTNIHLSVLLSLIVLSIVIWCIFMIMFIYGMIIAPFMIVKTRRQFGKSLKQYCTDTLNMLVRDLVRKHHLSREELINRGILDRKQVYANPLLHGTTQEFKHVHRYDEKHPIHVNEDLVSVTSLFENVAVQPTDFTQNIYGSTHHAELKSSLTYASPHNRADSPSDLTFQKPSTNQFIQPSMKQSRLHVTTGTFNTVPIDPFASPDDAYAPTNENFGMSSRQVNEFYNRPTRGPEHAYQPSTNNMVMDEQPQTRKDSLSQRQYSDFDLGADSNMGPRSLAPLRPSLPTDETMASPFSDVSEYEPEILYRPQQGVPYPIEGVPYPVRGVSLYNDGRTYSSEHTS